jgi:hypothetical protein
MPSGKFSGFLKANITSIDLLMQQTFPKEQEPLGRPPNIEQTDPGVQIPDSPLGDIFEICEAYCTNVIDHIETY